MTLHKQPSITKTKHHSVNEASTQSPLRTRFPLHHPTPNPAPPNTPSQKPPKAKPFTPHYLHTHTHTHTQSTKHTLRTSSHNKPQRKQTPFTLSSSPPPTQPPHHPLKNSYPACVSLKHRTRKHCSFPARSTALLLLVLPPPDCIYDKRRCWRSVVALLPDCG